MPKTTINGSTQNLKKCNVIINGVSDKCKKITVNGDVVWNGIESLYSQGDQVSDLTGGWTTSKSFILQYSSGELNSGFNKNTLAVYNDTNMYLEYGNGDGGHGGCATYTVNPINFKEEGIKSITINCSTTIGGWGYHDGKWADGEAYGWWTIGIVPTMENNQKCTMYYGHTYPSWYINGTSTTTRTESFSKTLTGLDSLDGSYYVVVGIYRSVPVAFFSMTIDSITCET